MTFIWGVLSIFVVCPILGGLPLIDWIFRLFQGRSLTSVGTGNISVSAAFYHGGQWVGILAVLSEALKGIAAVLLARYFFPTEPVWEIIALIAVVMGRYWGGRGAGTTNVVWGMIVHDWRVSGLLMLIGGVGFTLLREKTLGKFAILVLLPLLTALLHPYAGDRIGATVTLSILLGWIYSKMPDDLELPTETARGESRKVFRFFRGDRALLTLDQPLKSDKVGSKASVLADLRRRGYPVPMGWVLPPGDDPAPLIELLHPTAEQPLIVRSSAIGEDSETSSAAGQYESIPHVTSQPALEQAIMRCQMSYNLPAAVQYRQQRSSIEGGMAVLVQEQVKGAFSGVAFSRDPITRQGEAVVIEALPGAASQVVSGQITPEQYQVWLPASGAPVASESWILPDAVQLEMEGEGDVPRRLIQQVAYLARHLEALHHGIPQDVEWTYDGQQLWVLQARPITTLLPIWTRKIAAEVIPGLIRPLTWSINRPLTCGAWGDLFTLVLGRRSHGLDFAETATLHHSAAYFNASLLGQIFLRMGLPPESLEFLTRGAKFSKPPMRSTLQNTPGLLRLVKREIRLEQDFNRDEQKWFQPGLAALRQQPAEMQTPADLLARIEQILLLLRRATYYSILAPLSLAVRQGLFKVSETELDNSQTPEVASLRSLQTLASQARQTLDPTQFTPDASQLFASLRATPEGQAILRQFYDFLQQYGYLSDVGTDIAVPTWQEDPSPVQNLLAQLLVSPPPEVEGRRSPQSKAQRVQRRLNLKGRVTAVYSRLLAELRWSFVALEKAWLASGLLKEPEDIFFLKYDEIRQLIEESNPALRQQVGELIQQRRSQLEQDRQQNPIPTLVYGNDPPQRLSFTSRTPASRQLAGIGASPGQAEGVVLVWRSLQTLPTLNPDTILVVPYTDSGWAPLLAQAAGVIAEVGGRLSHGAIIAREYGIPAVMDVQHATQILQDGQRVRIDGQMGTIDLL